MTVTKAELDALRASLPQARPGVELTPRGTIAQVVKQQHFDKHTRQIKTAEQSLTLAQHILRQDLDIARKQGAERAIFNAQSHTGACQQQV